jgi:hypothetical protein
MEITLQNAEDNLVDVLVNDHTLAEAAEAEALVDAATAELAKATDQSTTKGAKMSKSETRQLVADIKARHNDESLKYRSSELPEAHTELGIDDCVGDDTVFDNLVTVQDDWNASAAEKRASGDAEIREDMAYMATAGVDWWGSISLSGFGPTAVVDAGHSGQSLQTDGNEVIVTYKPVDADEVREDAGMRKAGAVEYRGTVGGMYRDFLQAASVSTPELDDLFTAEGYSWDNLSEAEMEDKALNIQAWWV